MIVLSLNEASTRCTARSQCVTGVFFYHWWITLPKSISKLNVQSTKQLNSMVGWNIDRHLYFNGLVLNPKHRDLLHMFY